MRIKHGFVRGLLGVILLFLSQAALSSPAEVKLRIVKVKSGQLFRDYGLVDALPTELIITSHPSRVELKLLHDGRELMTLLSNYGNDRSTDRFFDLSLNPEKIIVVTSEGRKSSVPYNYYVWADIKMRLTLADENKPADVEFLERLTNQAKYGAPIVLGELNLSDEKFLIIADDHWGGKEDPFRRIPKAPLKVDPGGLPSAGKCSSLFVKTPHYVR